ncbi:protein FrlC [Agromyces flavus]|uniref:Protein FrlC n=1 Tax=Agromyces flavus TaxID=589382 RepID=A0A1H1ZZ48_9MICO|nr:TIM barrel protein [Agromyces flavus]MCP2367354.1 protein FrlC [Agromyces flavus]GGI45894.1 AP endonuclease [Agromyces flavus]SDT39081.1 protein FrlC [Agromyces flavus]
MSAIRLEQFTGSNFSYQHLPFERFLDDMVDLGRERVELWGTAPQLHVPQLSNEEARGIRRRIDERGLAVQCLTPEQVIYPVNVASPSPWLRASSIGMFRRAAELCVELGAPLLFLTPGRGFENEATDAAWRRSVDAIGEIAAYAGRLGVSCVLEPLQRVESNLVNDAATLAHMLDEIAAPNLGAALDTVAMAVAGDTVDAYFDLLGDRIRHVHLIDGRPNGHLAWGDGELPLGSYLEALGRRGYDGCLTFELFGDGTYAFDPRLALERCFAAVERELVAAATA